MKSKSEIAHIHSKEHQATPLEDASGQLQPAEGPRHEEIQRRAYEIHLERGRGHGQDLEDWLQAERELKAEHSTS